MPEIFIAIGKYQFEREGWKPAGPEIYFGNFIRFKRPRTDSRGNNYSVPDLSLREYLFSSFQTFCLASR
jgi:hypothetical protein